MRRAFRMLAPVVGVALFAAWTVEAMAQDLHPSRRPSPLGLARTTLDDGTYVRINYGRPYKRGRDVIFGQEEDGALVPFGRLWRTGANEATEITTIGDIQIGDHRLPAGTYSLFTTPGPEEWTIHFNTAVGLSGTFRFDPEARSFEPAYSPDNDIVVVTAEPTQLEEEVDQFTISFERSEAGADLVMRWITTEVRVPIRPAS